MEARTHKSLLSWSGILVLGAIVLLLNGVSSVAFRRFYVDLTEEGLYSLSPGTKNILANIEEPVTLHFYFSRTDSSELSTIKLYGSRILDLLKQYERAGKGKVNLEVHDPRPDSEDEEWAQKYGLQPMQLREGESIFLGLAGVSSVGSEQVIPVFNFQRQEFLEYDVTKLIYSLLAESKPKLGILSSVDVKGSPTPQMPGMPPSGAEPWFFTTQLESVTNLVYLQNSLTSIADDIQVLMLIHPKDLPEPALYAIDQFVLRGGKLFVFTDPYCNSDKPAADPSNPMAAMTANKSSNLNRLLEQWGVKQLENKAVADIGMATKVNAGAGGVKDFVLWLSIPKTGMNQTDVATSALDGILLPWAGALELTKLEGITTEPLLQTTERAMLVDEKDFRFGGGEPDNLLRNYAPGGKSYLLAARVSGKFKSNFPDGKPAAAEKGPEDQQPPAQESSSSTTHLKESSGESNVVIITDVDMLSDQYSLLAQNVFGRRFISPLNDNQAFMQNIAENLSGSNDLISIRSRGKFTRPFTKVDELSRDASVRWQQEEAVFQAKLTAANQRLAQLQATAQGGDQKSSQQILSGAVREEIKQLRAEKSDAQKRLREVRRNLREDVERLGTRLFLINTFLVPFLLVLISVGLIVSKRRKTNS